MAKDKEIVKEKGITYFDFEKPIQELERSA